MNIATPSTAVVNRESLFSWLPGWILLVMLPLTLLAALTDRLPAWLAGIPIWLALLLLFGRQQRVQRVQSLMLLTAGAAGLLIGLVVNGDSGYLLKALEANQMIVSMLVAVSFLRLVTLKALASEEQLPVGPRALHGTLLGGHLVGAVINISSVVILGDRLSAQRPLTTLQGLTLLRAFSVCAVWSPFFAAMGVVLISAPGAQLGTLVLFGLPVACIALLISAWQIGRHPQASTTPGYPLHLGALWMPVLLALLVMLAHHFWPRVSVLTLVTLIALLFTLLWVPLREGVDGMRQLQQHVQTGLPRLASEISLFVAAAVLAAGVAALLTALDIRLAPAHFGSVEACVTVLVLVGASLIGMHPVTSVVLAGSILLPAVDDPNLLGITLLLSWSLGIGLSPFSGVQICLQSRYGISARRLMRLNAYYTPVMLLVAFATIAVYSLTMGR